MFTTASDAALIQEEFVHETEHYLPLLTPAEARRLAQYCRALATVFYDDDIPHLEDGMNRVLPEAGQILDIQTMARAADGPFSTRVQNASGTAWLYATVPNPERPVVRTSTEPPFVSHSWEYPEALRRELDQVNEIRGELLCL